ncbi:predicted protein [Sclerotinia sclerotiorum 1980 UF-70]|uniref:Uncharacterized protein n=1 Tax=Sclerotinia sclerotiorum (strain ATCC 18683 / 1980 / Ss-1) TaxID=665079 RepID=A7ERL4_SCLS1|nr:predicted protein [Sclerotinia sclerotiorum 1980 UF-70]EDN92106.1 predicted protein [Sclerotinia sclerotiorum 1980 UF-70]
MAEYIHYSCGTIDQKKVTENKRAELEWWIEGILREDSDSFELEEERKRVIIAPIQKMIVRRHSGRNGGCFPSLIDIVNGSRRKRRRDFVTIVVLLTIVCPKV